METLSAYTRSYSWGSWFSRWSPRDLGLRGDGFSIAGQCTLAPPSATQLDNKGRYGTHLPSEIDPMRSADYICHCSVSQLGIRGIRDRSGHARARPAVAECTFGVNVWNFCC